MSNEPRNRRPLSRLGAWALAFGCIVGWGCFVMPGTLFLPDAGPVGTAIALTIGAVFMVLIAINYRRMIQAFPTHGGAFVYADEMFGHGHAFACGWFLLLALFSILAQNASALSLVSRDLMGSFAEFGFSYTTAGYVTYLGDIILSVAAIGIIAFCVARKVRLAYLLQVIFAFCLVAFLVAVVGATVTGAVPTLGSIQPAFSPGKPTALGVLAVLSVAPWAYVGFDIVSHVADEFSFPTRKIGGVMIASIVVAALVYISANTLAAGVVPDQFSSWTDHVSSIGSASGIASVPVFDAFISTFGDYGPIVLDVAVLGAILSGITGSLIAMSRLIAAMAEHGQLPHWLGVRSEKTGAPVHAILTLFIVGALFMLIGRSVLAWMMDLSSVGAAIAFFYTSAGAFRLARKEGRAGLKVTGAIGAAFSVAAIVLLMVPIPMLGTTFDVQSAVFLISWIALGLNFDMPQHTRHERLRLGNRTEIDSQPPLE